MQAFENLNLPTLLDTIVSLSTAFVLGGLIGFERQVRQRTAGLRTNTLVAVGAAVFVDMANRLGGHEGAVHVVAYVVSGIGFLGAGASMKEGANVTGLNTAATLWGSAAVGACAGADLIGEALMAALFVVASNTAAAGGEPHQPPARERRIDRGDVSRLRDLPTWRSVGGS